jgi:MinD-like ATPase involved in chromosome partitioning or flagellar assembly
VLIAVAAAKGSPGVTTTAHVLASVWPGDVVLADCDPAGGDVALLGRRDGGGALDPDRGLLSLTAAVRRGLAVDALDDHLQRIEGGLDVLCGVASPEQVTGIGPLWPTLAGVLAHAPGRDVIADCGRLTPGTPSFPVVTAADVVVLVVRPRLEAYAHLRERLRWLAAGQGGPHAGPAVGIVLVTDPRDHQSAQDLTRLLAHSGLHAAVLGRLADDARAADVVAGRVERGISRSLLVRSARELVGPIRALAASRGLAAVSV